jgi:hypothetical protein
MGGVIAVEGGDVEHLSAAVAEVLQRGGVVGVFPEGGVGPTEGRLQPLRHGIAHFSVRNRAPVVVAGIAGTSELGVARRSDCGWGGACLAHLCSSPSIGVPADQAILTTLLLLVERALGVLSHTDRRRVVHSHLPLRAMVDVTVEVVHTKRTVALLHELLEIRTAPHAIYDKGLCSISPEPRTRSAQRPRPWRRPGCSPST